MQPVRLGAFLLMDTISRTAHGHVYRAVHPEQKLTVAVKLVVGNWDEKARLQFRGEMRHLASLDHPQIIHLFEYGETPADVAKKLEVPERTPYCVVEHASGGSAARRRWNWSWLRHTLLEVLGALAHSHSRGLLHGGLSPENVLFCVAVDSRAGIRVTDFGLADLRRRAGHPVADPGYSAPEQIGGDVRAYGPWTDLFAVGAIAYRLASGLRPFEDKPHASPVPLKSPYPVPEGFADWVHKNLSWQPQDRFQRAADAAWALVQLKESVAMPRRPVGPTITPDKKARTEDLPTEEVPYELPLPDTTSADEESTGTLFLPVGVASGAIPPIPRTWRRVDPPERPLPFLDVGLRLFGLRCAPLVGRGRERDAMWTALCTVAQTRRPAGLLVRGRRGSGRWRVVKWVAERAHELGTAESLMAVIGAHDVPGAPLRTMLAEVLRTSRLPAKRIEARVRDYLAHLGPIDETLVADLTRYLNPQRDESAPLLETAAERHATLVRFLGAMASHRPVILALGDAHRDLDALAVAEAILRSEAAVLVLLTARSDELGQYPDEAARLGEMQTAGLLSALPLGPLPDEDHHELVAQLLGHAGSLSARVARVTRGDARFAVELISDWVERGYLAVGGTGLVLKEEAPVPGRIGQLWEERLDRVCAGLTDDGLRMLLVAAALGLRVDDEEWQEATDYAPGMDELGAGRVAIKPESARMRYHLLDALLSARLVEETALGFSFVDDQIAGLVAGRVQEDYRWADAHRAAARMLERRASHGQAGALERVGLHRLAAGDREGALVPLMGGVEERISTTGYRAALALLTTFAECLRELALPDPDLRWGQLWVTRARLSFLKGDYNGARRWATRAIEGGRKHGWDDVVMQGRFQRAQVSLRRSDLAAAEEDFFAMKHAAADGSETMGRALFGLAAVSRYRNEYDQAFLRYGEACRHFQAADHEAGAASCYRDIAALELALDQPDRAESLFQRAYTTYEKLGLRYEMANCLNGLAEVARKRGDFASAERGYRRAIEVYEAVGGGQVVIPRLNLALLALKQGDWSGARRMFDHVRLHVAQQGRRRLLASASVGLAASAAGLGRWDMFDEHLHVAEELRHELKLADPDCGWTAMLAGDLARRRGEKDRAARAWEFAMTQYEGVEDTASCAAVQERLNAAD